jgi:hypothetical protein
MYVIKSTKEEYMIKKDELLQSIKNRLVTGICLAESASSNARGNKKANKELRKFLGALKNDVAELRKQLMSVE